MFDLFLFREKCQKSKDLLNTIFKFEKDKSSVGIAKSQLVSAKTEPMEGFALPDEDDSSSQAPTIRKTNADDVPLSKTNTNDVPLSNDDMTDFAFEFVGNIAEKEETGELEDAVPEYLEDEFLWEENINGTNKDDDTLGEVVEQTEVIDETEVLEENSSSPDSSSVQTAIPKSRLSCFFCHKKMRPDKSHQDHVDQHDNSFKFILDSISMFCCHCCSMVFPERMSFLEHFESMVDCTLNEDGCLKEEEQCTEFVHLEQSTLMCASLGEKSKKLLSPRFVSTDVGETRLQCTSCSNEHELYDLDEFIEHIKTGHEDDTDSMLVQPDYVAYRCCLCNKWSKNAFEILLHVYLHSQEFHCPFGDCGNVYRKLRYLLGHLEKIHFQVVSANCKLCEKEFDTHRNLVAHQKNDCPYRTEYMCDVCDKVFALPANLRAHQRIHSASRQYACPVCEKRFNQLGDLKVHSRTHTDERPYKCNICEKTFRTYGHRSDHMSTHVDTKQFPCEICGVSFKSARILRSHLPLHSTDRKFQCKVCKKTFRRNTHLKGHMKVHEKSTMVKVRAHTE